MEFRGLTGKDFFKIISLLNKLDIKKLLTELFNTDNQTQGVEESGQRILLSVLDALMENLPACEEEINALLADLVGLQVEEVANLPFSDYTQLIIDFVKHEDFKDFLKQISSFNLAVEV